jgi:hypothetical protein
MFKKFFLATALALFMVPTVFAGTGGEMLTTTEVTAESSMMPCYDCGYGSGISLNVSTVVSTEADHIYLYGSYNVYAVDSKKEAVQELASVFADLKAATGDYGILTRSSVYTYSNWEYTNLYDGSLSVRLELTDHSALNDVEDLFYEKNFDNWADIQVTDTNAVKRSAVTTLKSMIKEQKSIYEELLEYSLGRIAGLSIYTTVDSSTYDPETNLVDVTVWADVSYQNE